MRGRPGEPSTSSRTSFDDAWAAIETALVDGCRREIVAAASHARTLGHALRSLRDGMRANSFKAGRRRVDLDAVVQEYDRRTRAEGFHVLHDWDGKAEQFNDDTIAVEVLNFVIEHRGDSAADSIAPAVLLDYYFLYLLALLSVRAWDAGDVNRNLDRVTDLLAALQGPEGSGQQFAADAETLVVIATSHYEPEEVGYARLFGRLGNLDGVHTARMGLVHAACMGGHLRFGYEATYNRDVVAMRDDNVVDYPWLLYGLVAVMREYVRLRAEGRDPAELDGLVESILNGLTPDPRAVLTDPPAFFESLESDRLEFCDGLSRYRDDLVPVFKRLRPTDDAYSPYSFFFNFSQNVLKGAVIDALLWGEAWTLSLNDMFTGLPTGALRNQARARLARTVMGYARQSPDTIRGRLMPAIVYDPQAGRRAYRITMTEIG